MSPEKQRIEIAKACGWEYHPERNQVYCWWHPDRDRHNGFKTPPDYLRDLNAMHEAEKVLTDERWPRYTSVLYDVTGWTPENEVWTVHASAAQRAEAFLRTIGKWEEAQ